MSNSWPFTAKVNPNRLAQEFMWEHQNESEFSQLTGENYTKFFGETTRWAGDDDNPAKPSGMIKTHQDLKSGGTTIDIPVFTVPNTMPFAGDVDMTNRGVTAGIEYMQVKLNKYQDAYDWVMGMEAQKVGVIGERELNRASDMLRRRFTMFTDRDLYYTTFNGTSQVLTSMSAMPGATTQMTPHSHGNFFTADGVQASYTNGRPGTSGYEDTVDGQLTQMGNADFTTSLIEDLEIYATELKIPYFETRAGRFRILLAHPSQVRQLKRDNRFEQAYLAGGQGLGFEGPAFKNFQARWSQTLIFASPYVFGVQKTAAGAIARESATYNTIPKYGPANPQLNTTDQNDLKGAIMLGPNMITKAIGKSPIRFTGYENEAQEVKKLILRAYQAYVLSDIWDQDGTHGLTAGQYHRNESSLVCFSYSPSRRS